MATIGTMKVVEGLIRIRSSVILHPHRQETPNERVSTQPRAPQTYARDEWDGRLGDPGHPGDVGLVRVEPGPRRLRIATLAPARKGRRDAADAPRAGGHRPDAQLS